MKKTMNKQSMDFFKKLVNSWGPSGYEDEIRNVWKSELTNQCDSIEIDYQGNIISKLNKEKKPLIVIAGHIDEIGFHVRYIDDDGYVYVRQIGGFDISQLPARKVKIHTQTMDIIGIVGSKPIHLTKGDKDSMPNSIDQLYIDIGAKDGKEAKELIEIGDPVTYDNTIEPMMNDLYCARAFDNRAGAFVVAEVMKNVYKNKDIFKAGLYCVGSSQEEAGARGIKSLSSVIKPNIGIAVDGTFAIDTPDANHKKDGNVKLGEGPALARGANTNPKLFRKLIEICKNNNIPYQIEAEPSGNGTDADPMQTQMGCAAALVSIPLRYMHTQFEVININDVENIIKLLTEFCLSIDDKIDLIQ